MKVILSVNPIRPQLTGIGRYTWELATRIPSLPQTESIRYFNNGKWIGQLESLLSQSPLKLKARSRLIRNPIVRRSYALLAPYLFELRLNQHSDHVFHGPNFYLPQFAGRSVVTIHDLSIVRFPHFHPAERVAFMESQIRHSMKMTSYVITDSDYTRQECIDYFGWPSDRIRAIPLGVTSDFVPRSITRTQAMLSQYGIRHGEYALCVATIEPRKNIGALIEAYSRIPSTLKARFPLVLAGGKGWRSEEIHRRIESAEREGWVKYLGYVDEDALPVLYAGARCFAFPSHYEGFGLPILEAMACGIPTLISDQSSLPEVAQGVALIVKPDDVVGISDALERLLEDEVWRIYAASRSVEIAAQYTWQRTVERTAEVYAAVASL